MTDRLIKEEQAIAVTNQIESQTAEMPDIWFSREDISEEDAPFLPMLVADSFAQWLKESSYDLHSEVGDLTVMLATEDEDEKFVNIEDNNTDWAYGFTAQTLKSIVRERKQFEQLLQEDGTYISAIPIVTRSTDKVFAFMLCRSNDGSGQAARLLMAYGNHFRSCFYRRFEQLYVQDLLQQQRKLDRELHRRDRLFGMTKIIHAQVDVTGVLTELLSHLEQLYPEASIYLYLTQDYLSSDMRVRPLVFHNETSDLVTKAFLDAKAVREYEQEGALHLAMPMTGKQSAYGVLSITLSAGTWDESTLAACLLLAETAGAAFENVKLFEQSNMLINELRLINELTKRLNLSLRLNELFQFVTSELTRIFEADYCCVLQINDQSSFFTVMSSNFPEMDREQFSVEYGFCGIVYRSKEPYIMSDYWSKRVVPSKLMDSTGSRSLMASPILIDGEVVGVILITHKAPNFFSYDNYKLLQVMSTHIGLAITNASLHAEVRRLAITDHLTELYVRYYLNEQIQRRMKTDSHGSLILVDIDHFKQVNDTFGHQVGDQVLVLTSQIIRRAIRKVDIAARWGGEELAIYLPGVHETQGMRIAERIRLIVEQETNPRITVSCGVSEWSSDHEKISVESLFYRADMALYQAKHSGRNCVVLGQYG